MAKKRLIKKHSVKANLHVVELTRAGSSLDLAIYADQEKMSLFTASLLVFRCGRWRIGEAKQPLSMPV